MDFRAYQIYPGLNGVGSNFGAGMVSDPGDYRWSSYRAHAFGVKAQLWSPHRLYLDLEDSSRRRQHTWRALIADAASGELLAKIRLCSNTGPVLGTETFLEQVKR
jgi:putative transposase